MKYLGYNFRLPDLNCALGISQIKKLNNYIKKREKIAKIYDKFFLNNIKFKIPNKITKNTNSFHLYPLLLNLKEIKKHKDKIISEFLKKNIKIQVHYIPVNFQPYYQKKYGFKKKNFQNSMKFFKNIISLPIYYDLSLKEINYIKKICKKIFKM